MYRFLAHFSLTWVEGKALVRNVSCVSSMGRRLGTLLTGRGPVKKMSTSLLRAASQAWRPAPPVRQQKRHACPALAGRGPLVRGPTYLSTKAAWSGVAAHEVMRYPASHRRWMPSEGYWKSSSTHCHGGKGRGSITKDSARQL